MKPGDFIRVRLDHHNSSRAGLDGMVMSPMDEDGFVGLIFGTDRHNEIQHCECVGTEMWHRDELDLNTLTT